MTRGGRWTALALATVSVAVGASVGWAVVGGDGAYPNRLVRYADDRGEANRFVDLDDGGAQLSIGSPDGHAVVVQWRDPDGHGWTPPKTVWNDAKNVAIENTVRYGGGTVAVEQLYSTDVHSDSDIDSVTVAIVCRRLACTAQSGSGFGGEAQVTPDGRTVYLGQDEKGAHLWTPSRGIHLLPWAGHPGFEYHVVSPSDPVLAPDGSLRVVSSHPSRRSCRFELLASRPGAAALSRVGIATQQLRGREESDCASYLRTYSADWVEVHPKDHRAPDFWFIRDGDAWTTTRHDPSGLVLLHLDHGCCDTSSVGFVHWNDVAFGSPDAHQILVQTHLLGDESWSKPQLLRGAPAGYRCTWQDGAEVGTAGFVVIMTCHSGKVRDEFSGDSYAVAATEDLRHWKSTFVTGVHRAPKIEDDRFIVGDTTWTPEDGFVRH